MTVNLRAHPASLSAATLNHADPLRLLRIINHVPAWLRCSITITKPRPGTTHLTFRFHGDADSQNPPDVTRCLDGIVPEVFDCDDLKVEHTNLYRLRNPRTALDKTRNSLYVRFSSAPLDGPPECSCIRLTNYHRDFVLPEFSSEANVIGRLRSDTLMDCGDVTLGNRTVTISLLSAQAQTINRMGFNRSRLRQLRQEDLSTCSVVHRFDDVDVGIDLLSWVSTPGRALSRIRIYVGGVPVALPRLPSIEQSLIQPFRKNLDVRSRRYLGLAARGYNARESSQLRPRPSTCERRPMRCCHN